MGAQPRNIPHLKQLRIVGRARMAQASRLIRSRVLSRLIDALRQYRSVTDALMNASDNLLLPAHISRGRTYHLSALFVGDALLSESGMKDRLRCVPIVRFAGRRSESRLIA